MRRFIALASCLLLLGACATATNTRLADKAAPKPVAGAKILIIQPDVQLSMLTAAGMQEPKADWSMRGRDNIATELAAATKGRSHVFRQLDPDKAEDPKVVQLLRLHGAVGQTIGAFNYGLYKLPNKNGAFDWTLGEGAQTLGQVYDADYALFTYGRGSYASDGRKAAMVLMAMVGASLPLGGQTAFASLVDLKTGRVVWFNVAVAAPNADMRDPEGAKSFVTALLKDAPL